MAFKKATNLKSELTDAWLNVAMLKGAKNEKDALDYFNTAIRLDSTNAAILHAKAPLENSRCYVTLFPCHECAKRIDEHS